MSNIDIEKNRGMSRRDFLIKFGEATIIAAIAPHFLFNTKSTKAAEATEFSTDSWKIKGVPDRVALDQIDRANLGRGFTNTLYGGSEQMLAEPGVLKVGWDFPREQFKAAGQSIYHYDPGNQYILENAEGSVNVPEGAFGMFNGNAMVIEVSGNGSARFRLEIGGPVSNHNIVVMRGLYPDGSTPADRNRIAHITGYTPGAVLWDMYPKGGFISQGQFEQIAKNALTENPNCGAEGCRVLRAYFLDLNTGAFSVMAKPGIDKLWEESGSNWR